MLRVDNTRVCVADATEFELRVLDAALQYQTRADARQVEQQDLPDEDQWCWDGMTRLLRRPKPRRDGSRADPWFETGLLGRAMRALAGAGLAVSFADFRQRPESDPDVPRFWPPADQPLRDYQEAAVRACERNGRGVVVAPPRAGKTRIIQELVRRLGLPTLLVAPTSAIVDQTVTSLHRYGYAPTDVTRLEGRVDWQRAASTWIWIVTSAKAMSLPQEACRLRQVVICDELHHFTKGGGWGRALHKLFPHVFHWYGTSGTYFRSGGDDMALEAFLSEVVYEIKSKELVDRGLLVRTRLGFVPVLGNQRLSDPRRDGVHFHEYRNSLAAAAALHMAQRGRRTLVMVGLKEQGRRIEEMINRNGPGGKASGWKFAEFLYRGRGGAGEADAKLRRNLIAAFLEGSGPRVLLGTSLLGEGVDLPDTDAMVWARGESAAVSYLQGLYRVSTAAAGKQEALVLDFADRHHPNLLKASLERLRIAAQDPVFQCQVLPSAESIAAWCQ